MEFKVCVISTFIVRDPSSNLFTTKVKHEIFSCMNDALEAIRNYDYPCNKISIHLLTH